MEAGDVFLIIFLLLVVAGIAGCWWHRRKIRLQQEMFIAWAGEQLQSTRSRRGSRSTASSVGASDEDSSGRRRLNSGYSDASDMSFISVDFAVEENGSEMELELWTNIRFGISVDYPKSWRVHKKTTGNEQTSQLLVEIVVRRHEDVYMRLSVAFDDVCWSKLTPRTFSRHMVSELPTAVPGSRVLRQGPVPESNSGAFEVAYTVPDEDGHELNILSYFFVGNKYAFTVSFTIESPSYHQYEHFGRKLLNSFDVKPLMELRVANVQETFQDPSRTNWSQLEAGLDEANALVRAHLSHPAHWKRELVENPRVVRFCCGRGEQCLKMINYFVVDMSTLDVSNDDELLNDLVMFYKQEVGQQGTQLLKEMNVMAGERKAGMNGPFYAFQTSSKRRFVNIKSHVLVGLHRNTKVFGHILTVSVSEDYFVKYQKFAQFVFKRFMELNDVKELGAAGMEDGEDDEKRQRSSSSSNNSRNRSASGRLLTNLDFESSSV